MTTKYVIAAGGNSNASGTWSNVSSASAGGDGVPTAADDVVLDAGSGQLTINAAMVCRSFECNNATTYANTITHNAAVAVTVGDGTAGANNIALRLAGNYNPLNSTTSSWSFISTSATQQSIYSASKTIGNIVVNPASNGSWILQDNLTMAAGSTLTHTRGSLDFNGKTLSLATYSSSNSNVRALTCGAATITCSGTAGWSLATSTNMTFTANTSTITLSASGSTFAGGGLTYYTGNITGAAVCTISGANTWTNLTRTGTNNKYCTLLLTANQTVTGTFTVDPDSIINNVLVTSDTRGTQRTITAAAFVASDRVDFRDLVGAGAATWTTGASGATYFGDCGGNSGITMTSGTTQTATGTASFSFSTVGVWTSRIPLPQDTAVINNAFVAGRTITMDMARVGTISCNCTGSPTFALTVNCSLFGSLDVTGCGAITTSITTIFEGRGNYTLNTIGLTWGSTGSITIDALTGKITLGGNFVGNSTMTLLLTSGEFDAATFNVSLQAFNSSGTTARTVTLGSGTWTFPNATSQWNTSTSTNLTVNYGTSTITFTSSASNQKLCQWGGITIYNFTAAADNISSSQALTIQNNLAINTAGFATGLLLANSATTTVNGTISTNGSVGNLAKLGSTSGGVAHVLSCPNGAVLDYMSITDSTATSPSRSFYAGPNSTNGGNNTGWIFQITQNRVSTIPMYFLAT